MEEIYLDYNSTAPVHPLLLSKLSEQAQFFFANPSSLHRLGRQSKELIHQLENEFFIALNSQTTKSITSKNFNLYYTSGATESNQWVIRSFLTQAKLKNQVPTFIVSSIEHESILDLLDHLKSQAQVLKVQTLANGCLDLASLETQITNADLNPDSKLHCCVLVQHANNQTGVIQPIAEVATICQKAGVYLHVDASQSFLRTSYDFDLSLVHYLTFSAHKIGSLKGLGFLLAQPQAPLYALLHGKQQKAMRAGTENMLALACTQNYLAQFNQNQVNPFNPNLLNMRQEFEGQLKKSIPDLIIHGEASHKRLLNTSYLGFSGLNGSSLVMALDQHHIAVSSGSACSSGTTNPSHVLLAMGLERPLALSSIRVSSGHSTRWQDYEALLAILPSLVEKMRRLGKNSN